MPICQEAPSRRARFQPSIRSVRPSLIDPYLPDDRWIGGCCVPNCLIVYMNSRPVSQVAGSPLDQATLNSMLFKMRNRYPRRVRAVA
jgi:hypothetical protein